MQWIARKDIHDRSDLPKDQQFLGLWRGCICLLEYDEDKDVFCMVNQPSTYEVTDLPEEREAKITHICILELPPNQPEPMQPDNSRKLCDACGVNYYHPNSWSPGIAVKI